MPYDDLSMSAPPHQPPPTGGMVSLQPVVATGANNTAPKTPDKSGSLGLPTGLSDVSNQDRQSKRRSEEGHNLLRADLTPSHITDGATRKSSLKARAIIASALVDTDVDDDIVSRRKRASADDLGEQHRASSKRPRKNLVVDFDHIGCHKDEPKLLIRAKWVESGLKVSVFEEDVPAESQYWKLVENNGYVNLDNVDLDPHLFPTYEKRTQPLTKEKKSDLIKAYLCSLGRDWQTLDNKALNRLKEKHGGPILYVGVQREDRNLQSYSYLTADKKVLFGKDIQDTEIRASFGTTPEAISFNPNIDQGGDVALTKSFIKKKLMAMGKQGSSSDNAGIHGKQLGVFPTTRSVVTDHATEFKMSLNRARQAQKDCAQNFEAILVEMQRQFSVHEAEISSLKAALEGEKAENASQANAHEITKSQLESEVDNLRNELRDYEQLKQDNDDRQRILEDREQEIDSLKLHIKYLDGPGRRGEKSIEFQKPMVPTTQNLEGLTYCMKSEGEENAGKLIEARRIVVHAGRTFQENKVLQKLDLYVSGAKLDKQTEIDGILYDCYLEDGMPKYVSIIGPQSIAKRDGQLYIEWDVKKEVGEQDLFTI